MPVFGIRIDTKKSLHKALLSSDIRLNTQILEILYALAVLVERDPPSLYSYRVPEGARDRGDQDGEGDESVQSEIGSTIPPPLVVKIIRLSNPFDLIALVKSIRKELIDMVLDRTLYFKHESQRRKLENEKLALSLGGVAQQTQLRRQEVAVRQQDVSLRRQDVAIRKQEVELKRQEAELKKQEVILKKLENLEKAVYLKGQLDRIIDGNPPAAESRNERERVMQAVGDLLADQDAQLGSGNVQVYFKPPPKPPVKKKRLRLRKAPTRT